VLIGIVLAVHIWLMSPLSERCRKSVRETVIEEQSSPDGRYTVAASLGTDHLTDAYIMRLYLRTSGSTYLDDQHLIFVGQAGKAQRVVWKGPHQLSVYYQVPNQVAILSRRYQDVTITYIPRQCDEWGQ
jgi:hypothetical protein